MSIVESLSLPDTFEEWDVGGGSLADYRERYTAAIKEIKAAIGIHLLSNLLLLVPLIFTGKLAKIIHPSFPMFQLSMCAQGIFCLWSTWKQLQKRQMHSA